VTAALFLGDRTRLSVAGIGDEPVIVETSGRQNIAVGDMVTLRIAEGALLTLQEP